MSQTQKISRNNTAILSSDDGSKSVILHSTEIVRWNPEKRTLRLNSGGWFTVTTRTRMNQALNEWGIPGGVSFAGGRPIYVRDGASVPFTGNVCEVDL